LKVLIGHFFNEEFLLPYWVRHHQRLFDHAVLIDYASTDRSVEIIREMAPTWEIRPSVLMDFGAWENDQYMMAVEQETEQRFPGSWKTVLNTTEFLLAADLDMLDQWLGSRVAPMGVAMIDHPDRRPDPLDKPDLFSMKHHGCLDLGHRRLIHRQPHGNYTPGRHNWTGGAPTMGNMFLLWFGWSPMDHIKGRKLQIQTRIPESDKQAGLGWHHLVDEPELERRYLEEEVPRMRDLLQYPDYRATLERVHTRYHLGPLPGEQHEDTTS
jgi:hypothetical protein